MSFLKGEVKLSTALLAAIALFDLLSTILLLGRGFAEANPLFAALLNNFGPLGFVLGKLLFTIGPILMIEYARTKRPATAEVGAWIAVFLYLWLYLRHILASFYG